MEVTSRTTRLTPRTSLTMEGDDVVVGALVAHDADAADGEEDAEGLPEFVVESGGLDFVDEDVVGLAEDVELFFVDGAEAADAEAGSWEGLAHDDVFGEAEEAADLADRRCGGS